MLAPALEDDKASSCAFERAASFAESVQLPLLEERIEIRGSRYDMDSLVDALRSARDKYAVEGAACGHVCSLDLWGGVAAACELVGLRSYAPAWGSCSEAQSSMRRILHDGAVLELTKFPEADFVGCTIGAPEEADEVLAVLRSICGPDATDDPDGGFVDCEFASNRFLPCGIREVVGVSFRHKVAIRENRVKKPGCPAVG